MPYVTAQLNARLQPLDRGDFEDRLQPFLEAEGLGEVTGGGTQMAEEPAGIAFCDLDIRLNDTSTATITALVAELERLGAPKGSKLVLDRMPDAIASAKEAGRQTVVLDEDGAVPLGRFEGLGLFLNGTDLPAAVYKNSDSNKEFDELLRLMGVAVAYCSYWNGSRETALYFYGPSFERMKAAIENFVATTPSCEKCRIEQIA